MDVALAASETMNDACIFVVDEVDEINKSGVYFVFFFSSRRRHTRFDCDWSSDMCSSDLVRQRVERWANQLVYGNRSTPYEALTGFSHRVAGAYADEEVLPRLARVLVEGTGATVASVWIRRAGDPIAAATWPDSASPLAADAADRVARVRHEGELLGELTVRKRSGEPFPPVEETLLSDLAAQAGQVVRNVRLTAELQARLREIAAQALELRASRQRIVAAQDAERRPLERTIHDGAQQHLVALAVKRPLP